MKLLLLYFMISLVFGMKSKKKKKDCSTHSDCDADSYCCIRDCEREANKCVKKLKNGQTCTFFPGGIDCKSGRCARISTGRFESVLKCKPRLGNGKECINFRDCKSLRCEGSRCKKSDIKDAEIGEGCYADADCLSDNCQRFSEPGVLGNISVRRCAEKKKEDGEKCSTDADCLSNNCQTDKFAYIPTKSCAQKKNNKKKSPKRRHRYFLE